MGIIIGKFRKKKTTYEALETLEKEIKSIEEYRRSTEQYHKKIVGRFILLSVVIYLLTAFVFYFYFLPATLYERLYYIVPLILAPVIIITVKRGLTWYYNRKISKKQSKLISLKEEKKKILEKVMDTETYKIAKTILEKFAPEQIRKTSVPLSSDITSPLKPRLSSITGTPQGLRQRALVAPQQSRLSIGSQATPMNRPIVSSVSSVALRSTVNTQGPYQLQGSTAGGLLPTPLPLPRAILPRDRSVLDKMVEYLVGDGPSNRYALICSQCSSHNGMALREEFEYLSFRCCYCYTFNPARKKRPAAPKLEYGVKTPIHSPKKFSDTSDSEKNSPSETDSETGSDGVPKKADIDGKVSDIEKTSDFDKLSDIELKTSDVENVPMDVDTTDKSLDVVHDEEQNKEEETITKD